MKTSWLVLLVGIPAAFSLPPQARAADPQVVHPMQGLEATLPTIGALHNGVRLIAPVQLKNTGKQFIALALVPPFPKASSSDGTTYFMQEESGVTRCRNNNPIMGPACMGKPFTEGITILPSAYTVLDPGATADLEFHMTVERGDGRGTYATFSALFAVRTFSSEDEDLARSDAENYRRTRSVNVGFSEVRIVPQSQK